MMKKLLIIGTALVVVIVCWHRIQALNIDSDFVVHDSGGAEYGSIISNALNSSVSLSDENFDLGVTSHHLPTAVHFIADFHRTLHASNPKRKLFIVIGPDHTEKCDAYISTSLTSYDTAFGLLEIDNEVVRDFVTHGVNLQSECFYKEHSIGAQADFIKFLYPKAKLVPIVISSSTSDDKIAELAELLSKYQRLATVIVSVDLNHYNTKPVADSFDRETIDMILRLDGKNLTLNNVDSPPSLRLAIELAKNELLSPDILSHANSHDLGGTFENTTGYVNVGFVGN